MRRCCGWPTRAGRHASACSSGGRLLDEDTYALSKLARTVLGTNDLDHRRGRQPVAVDRRGGADGDRPRARRHLSRPRARARDRRRRPGRRAGGADPAPAAAQGGRRAAPGSSWCIRATDAAARRRRARALPPGRRGARCSAGGADDDPRRRARGVASAGRPRGRAGGRAPGRRAATPHSPPPSTTGARFVLATRRAGDRGALARRRPPRARPRRPTSRRPGRARRAGGGLGPGDDRPGRGRDAIEIVRAAAGARARRPVSGRASTRSATRPTRPSRAARCRTSTPSSCSRWSSATSQPFVSVFLPAASILERDGHVSDWEGRSQRVRPLRTAGRDQPPGLGDLRGARGRRRAATSGFDTLDELHEEMARLLAPREVDRRAGAARPRRRPPTGSTLATYPLLIDDGRMSEDAPELKAALGDPPVAEVHPDDAAAHGLADGLGVRLRTAAGEAVVPAARHRAHRARHRVRAVQPAGVRGEHAAVRRVRRPRSSSRPWRRRRRTPGSAAEDAPAPAAVGGEPA